jgi:hypothetical protein
MLDQVKYPAQQGAGEGWAQRQFSREGREGLAGTVDRYTWSDPLAGGVWFVGYLSERLASGVEPLI